MARRNTMRERGDRWCRLEVSNDNGHLAICGSYGRILTPAAAKKDALEFWRSYFEEDPRQIFDMNQRRGTRFTSPTGAAKYVLSVDGPYHGIDVIREEGRKVYVMEGGGQCTEELREWFPEIAPVLRWHLFGFEGSQFPGPMHYEANARYWAELACGRARKHGFYTSTDPEADRARAIECFESVALFGALEDDTGEPWTLAPTTTTREPGINGLGQSCTVEKVTIGPLVEWLRARLPRLFEAFKRDVSACAFTAWVLR